MAENMCTYTYYVLSNGTNVVLGVMDPPGTYEQCYLYLEDRQSARVDTYGSIVWPEYTSS